MSLSTPIHFERSALRGATLEDLDLEAARQYLDRRAPTLLAHLSLEQALERVGFTARSGAAVVPAVAGVLLFGPCPSSFVPSGGSWQFESTGA